MPIFMRLPMRVQRYHHWIRGDGGGMQEGAVAGGEPGVPSRLDARDARSFTVQLITRSRRLILARLLRRQIASLSDSIQIQPAGRKLRYLPAAPGGEFHLENLSSDQTPSGAFVHGEEVPAHPVPALEVVGIVNAHLHFQLRLPPEAGPVRRRQSDSRIKVREF